MDASLGRDKAISVYEERRAAHEEKQSAESTEKRTALAKVYLSRTVPVFIKREKREEEKVKLENQMHRVEVIERLLGPPERRLAYIASIKPDGHQTPFKRLKRPM